MRFQRFCSSISEHLGAFNGYNLLNNNDKEKTPSHNGGNRNEDLEQYLKISNAIKNKEVIIIDDVRTSGASSNQIFRILKNLGVSKMIFVYLAKTVSSNATGETTDINQDIDDLDLPF